MVGFRNEHPEDFPRKGLWFDVTHRGERYRMPANDLRHPADGEGRRRPIASFEDATRKLGELACLEFGQLSRLTGELAPAAFMAPGVSVISCCA